MRTACSSSRAIVPTRCSRSRRASATPRRKQADLIRGGRSLREQVGFAAYLAARESNPALTFRDHLRGVGGEIEV